MNYTLVLFAVVLAVFVFFQYRSSKKRQRDAAERLRTLVPGVEVMTNFGLYGNLVSIDEDENMAYVEIAPKTIIKLHRQVLLRAVDPVVPEETTDSPDTADPSPEVSSSSSNPMTVEPEYGERTNGAKKPGRKKSASDSE